MYTNNCVINTVCRNILFRSSIYMQRRWKSKKVHWSVLAKKKYPVDKALEHFDDFYKTVFGRKWPSIRLALLSPHKYCAVINNFGDSDTVVSDLQNIGAMNIRTLFELEKENIKTKKNEERRRRDLEKIFKLDRKLEQMAITKQQEEFESLYPHRESSEGTSVSADILNRSSSDTSHGISDNINREDDAESNRDGMSQKSLQSSLREAEFDSHRLIDPASGLSAGALYEYVPATRLKGMEDWIVESQHYGYYRKDTDFPVCVESDNDFIFPVHLQVLLFERGNISSFPSPKRGSTDVLSKSRTLIPYNMN
ncbi:hypothetical protein B7P43_G12799 [Cryptotermes secundus]|uniref:Uncharacterized protein n=1 Tax=Cryptotermes secundus TaxID=105785 RepID=A0A2J7QGN3_9NEOP|nr:hypothetical protein B7P43_G12799 [Cryptotermes secundus]